MKTWKIVALILAAGVLCTGIGACNWALGTYNQAVDLKNLLETKEEANKASLAAVVNILKNKAGMANVSFEKLRDLQVAVADAKMGNGGTLAKFLTESGVNVADMDQYEDLQREITAQFTKFEKDQKATLDYRNQYNALRERVPHRFILGGFEDVDITIVLNAESAEAFETGSMPDLDLGNQGTGDTKKP